jgi:hypothetical protein
VRLRLATAAFRTNKEVHTTGYHKITWQNWQWRIRTKEKPETQTCQNYRLSLLSCPRAWQLYRTENLHPLRHCDRCGAKGSNERHTTWLRTQTQVATMRSSPVTKPSSQTDLLLRSRVTSYFILLVSAKNYITIVYSLYSIQSLQYIVCTVYSLYSMQSEHYSLYSIACTIYSLNIIVCTVYSLYRQRNI